MPKNTSRYYWLCQISGWSFLGLVMVLFSSTFNQEITRKLIGFLAVVVVAGILTTHIFREVIRRSGWLLLPVEKALPKLLIGVLLTCVVDSILRIAVVDHLGLSITHQKMDFIPRMLATTF